MEVLEFALVGVAAEVELLVRRLWEGLWSDSDRTDLAATLRFPRPGMVTKDNQEIERRENQWGVVRLH